MANTQILDYIKKLLCAKGILNLVSFHRVIRRYDKQDTGEITKEDLQDSFEKFKIHLAQNNFEKLFKLFDIENTGSISHEELYKTLIGEMSPSREELVEKAFHKLDQDKNGYIDTVDIIKVYDASKHPEVISKKKSAKELLALFLDTLEIHMNLLRV